MKRVIGAALSVALLCQVGSAAAQGVVVDLSEVEVRGVNTFALRVKVSGDLGPRTVVIGNIPGINCGGSAWLYTPHENRQCWVWVRRHTPVILRAQGMKGAIGKDWSVTWTGCEVVDGGAGCRTTLENETEITAVFRGEAE